jgi:arylsulfatase A-like enzyme
VNKHPRIVTLVAVLTLAASVSIAQADQPAADRQRPRGLPNVILILADDLRFDALGCMGNTMVVTPHIDALAARGAIFSNSFCTTSICPISRASILTGQYERRHKIADFNTPLSKRQFDRTFPALLRRHGYRIGFIGKWGLGDPLPEHEYDFFRGFSGQGSYFPPDKFGFPGEHLTAKQAVEAVQFLQGGRPDVPFLLQISLKAPHVQDDNQSRPFPPDPKFESLFRGVTITKPPTANEADFRALPEFLRTSEARSRWQTRFSTEALYQSTVKDYYRLISGIDELVGAVTSTLRQIRAARNTVILFTSDNGFYLGDRGLAGKWFMHEESIRVPLIICDLRRPPSGNVRRRGVPEFRIAEMALNIDLAPTILDFAHVDVPEEMQGKSLVPLLERKQVPWRDRFLYEHPFRHPKIPTTEGVRTTRWKYMRYTSVDPPVEQLFDLQKDPLEEHDLAHDPAAAKTLDEMRSEWHRLADLAK